MLSRETRREILKKSGKNPDRYEEDWKKSDDEKQKKRNADIDKKRKAVKREMKEAGIIA